MEQKSFTGCFGCGEDNESGLKAAFRNMENGDVEGYFTPNESHCGYEDAVHVGVIAAFFSEVMGRLALTKDKYYLTHSLDMTFKSAVSYGTKLRGHATLKRSAGDRFAAKGTVYGPDGEIIAEAEGRFVTMDSPRIKRRVG